MASLWCVRDKESTQIYQVLYASLKPGMEKAEATQGRDHSPSQHPQRRESQLLGSVYFDWRCVAFWKVRSVPLAIFIPQSLRTSPSSGQATPSSLLRDPQLPACHSGAAFIATKFGPTRYVQTGEFTGLDGSPENCRRAIEASLRRLRTDHVDLYYLHRAI
jgi:hypothetical protein